MSDEAGSMAPEQEQLDEPKKLQLSELELQALGERLEQLRALENDHPIHVVLTQHDSLGVDTEDDLNRIRAMVEARQGDSDA